MLNVGMTDPEQIWTQLGIAAPNEGDMAAAAAGSLRLAIYRVGGALYCTSNVCTHAFALLTDGWLEEYVIECPLHAGQFDIRTGCGMGPPIDRPVRTYPIRVTDGVVEVALPA